MTGPDPLELLSAARLLATAEESAPSDARLRRAVSTAYYALFHLLAGAAARRFVGSGAETGSAFGLLYRAFEHRQMKTICDGLGKSHLNPALQRQLGRTAVSRDIRDVAVAFCALQDARQLADYDPRNRLTPVSAASIIESSQRAVAAFDRIAPDELTDVLALMMVRARG